MTVSRKAIRSNLSTLLRAATLPSSTIKCFESVFEGPPDEVINEDMPTCIILIGRDRERRDTAPVGGGLKTITFDISLEFFFWVDASDDLLGERYLDDILDGVDQALRQQTTLSGAVALAYDEIETQNHGVVPSGSVAGPEGKILIHATRHVSAIAFDIG